MIELFYWPTPNGHKITLFLEEADVPYKITRINIGRGEQFTPDYLKVSPNNRMPAIIDHAPADGGAPRSACSGRARFFRTLRKRPDVSCRRISAAA